MTIGRILYEVDADHFANHMGEVSTWAGLIASSDIVVSRTVMQALYAVRDHPATLVSVRHAVKDAQTVVICLQASPRLLELHRLLREEWSAHQAGG